MGPSAVWRVGGVVAILIGSALLFTCAHGQADHAGGLCGPEQQLLGSSIVVSTCWEEACIYFLTSFDNEPDKRYSFWFC